MKKMIWLGIICVVSLMTLACSQEKAELLVFAGAGLKAPLQEVALAFEADTGIAIDYNFAGSGQHLSQMEVGSYGDIFIAGSEYHAKLAMEKDLIEEMKPIAYHVPVIAIRKSCPEQVESLEDLEKDGLVIGFGDVKATAIGKITPEIIQNAGLTEKLRNINVVYTATVNELLTHLEMETIDVAIVWGDLTHHVQNLDTIKIPVNVNIIDIIPGAIIKKSEHKKESAEFLEYLVSEKGESIFNDYGFDLVKNE